LVEGGIYPHRILIHDADPDKSRALAKTTRARVAKGNRPVASVSDVIGTSGSSGRLGWAQNAFAASDYGWVPINGAVYIMTTGSNTLTAGVVPVCAGGSAVSTGMCSMVATATGTLQGVTIVAHGSGGQTASATAASAILSWPRYSPPSAA
jgi:hypothetical protein